MSGLTPFYNTFNDPSSIVMATFGDSTTKGDITVTNGGWPEQLRLLADPGWGRGGDGCHTMDRNWKLTTSPNQWTQATASDVWDCAPILGFFTFPRPSAYKANGVGKIATWTKPASLSTTAFTFYMVDGASSDNFSYSIDDGSWINVSANWNHDNTIKKIRINSNVNSTVRVQAANAAGIAVNTYIIGVEPHTSNPGFVIHNVAGDGEKLSTTVRTTAGNWHGWLDIMQPPLVTIMYTNDLIVWSPTTYQQKLESFATVVTGYGGSLLILSFFEQAGRSVADQSAQRLINKTVASEFSMPIIDFYDLVGDNAATVAAGYMNSNEIHENNAGAVFMAQQVWALISRSNVGAKRRIE